MPSGVDHLPGLLNKTLGLGMQQTYAEREHQQLLQFTVVPGIIDYTDTIFPTGPNEGHFLKAHSAGLRPCGVPGYVCVKQCMEEEDFGED